MAWSGLIRPPQLQHSDTDAGTQRTATWLELFFDLAFLLVVAELAVGLRNDLTPHGVLVFARLFSSEALEAALWIALRTLEERAALARRLAEPARRRGHSVTATRFEEQAAEAQQAARLVRNLLLDRGSLATAWPPATEHHRADSPSSTERSGG